MMTMISSRAGIASCRITDLAREFVPKGYYTGSSYIGLLPGNKKMMFPTEAEYLDFIREMQCSDAA